MSVQGKLVWNGSFTGSWVKCNRWGWTGRQGSEHEGPASYKKSWAVGLHDTGEGTAGLRRQTLEEKSTQVTF